LPYGHLIEYFGRVYFFINFWAADHGIIGE
jgi:hypothetical protein